MRACFSIDDMINTISYVTICVAQIRRTDVTHSGDTLNPLIRALNDSIGTLTAMKLDANTTKLCGYYSEASNKLKHCATVEELIREWLFGCRRILITDVLGIRSIHDTFHFMINKFSELTNVPLSEVYEMKMKHVSTLVIREMIREHRLDISETCFPGHGILNLKMKTGAVKHLLDVETRPPTTLIGSTSSDMDIERADQLVNISWD
ncbi:p23 [Raspberry leaf mottle virus]|uniref:p23 n=1 Tax=Raspberry leaf mottle virus TaxID=326941 RepID=A0MBX2_9CLOS|nr:p23 [Raspberry leaf mottle virus]ABC87283.1 p23 [Raspberry leaf mottle virus]QRG29101.1 p23 [Raspberry leaf mottle virus]